MEKLVGVVWKSDIELKHVVDPATLSHGTVISRLDYCNGLYMGLTLRQLGIVDQYMMRMFSC